MEDWRFAESGREVVSGQWTVDSEMRFVESRGGSGVGGSGAGE